MSLDVAPDPISDPADLVVDEALLPDLRVAVDLVAQLRARVFRCLYYAQVAARPGQDKAAPDMLGQLREQAAHISHLAALLGGTDTQGRLDPKVCDFVARVAATHPDFTRDVTALCTRLDDMVRAFEASEGEAASGDEVDRAIKAFHDVGMTLIDKITRFCADFWTALDAARGQDVTLAREASTTIDETLERLSRIGKHVRLVSLNASVEASRAGDAGKGLAVIAVEFKSLAEEIQTLASTAREAINKVLH